MTYSLDTEDNSKGKLYWINIYSGRRHYSFKTKDSAIKFLGKCEGICWATNLEYDLINIFWGRLAEVKLYFGKTRLVKAKYKNLIFHDTLNHWKMSVNAMGEYLKIRKLKFKPTSLIYCQRDCEITYKFVKVMLGHYKAIGIDKVSSTISLTSFNLWRKISRYKLKRVPEEVVLKLKHAYYGGRVECFYIGKYKGDIFYVDINSMYPAVMRQTYPAPTFEKEIDLSAEGVSRVRVESNLDIPVLPYRRSDYKIIFPNGKFSGWWANEELRFAQSQGVKILKAYDGYVCHFICKPFGSYVDKLYFERQRAKSELLRYTYKIFLNSLYGKFAQGNERSVIEPLDKFKKRKNWGQFKLFEKDKLVLFTEKGKYPIHANYIFSLYTTAKARIKLYELITDIQSRGGQVLYCDTDGVIYRGDINYPFSDKLGEVKLEAKVKEIVIKSAKFYKIGGEFKVKGIPKLYQETFFEKEIAEYKKPLKLKEAIRRDLRPNIWIDYKKVRVVSYDKGVVTRSGKVEPHKIYSK